MYISAKKGDFRVRRPNMNFHEMGIPNGSTLESKSTDDIVQVVGPRKVKFRGESVSLTKATKSILMYNSTPYISYHWFYKGELLHDIYEKTYPKKC